MVCPVVMVTRCVLCYEAAGGRERNFSKDKTFPKFLYFQVNITFRNMSLDMDESIGFESPEDETEMVSYFEEENLPDYLWTQEENIKAQTPNVSIRKNRYDTSDQQESQEKSQKIDRQDDEFAFGDTTEKNQLQDAADVISDSLDSESNWSYEQCTDQDEMMKDTRYVDKVRVFRLRKKLNQLDSFQQEKELMIQKVREELKACQERIELLEQQKFSVEMDIQSEQKTNNVAAVFRLRALHKRLSTELINEEDVKTKIANILKDNEYDLWHIEVEQGKFTSLRERLQQDEEELDRQRKDLAEQRALRQKISLTLAERKKQTEKKEEAKLLKEREQQYRKAVEEAQKSHAKAVLFLKETMARVREMEAEKERKGREHMEKRMQAILSLKNSISTNRENLRAIESRNKAQAALTKRQEMLEKEAVLAKGGDVTKFIVHKQRLQEYERRKKEFEESQNKRKQEIVSRILQEESSQVKQKRQASLEMSRIREHGRLRARTLQYIQSAVETEPEDDHELMNKWRSPSPVSADEDDNSQTEWSPVVSAGLAHQFEGENENLAQPEFKGLWNEDLKPYKVPKDDIDTKPLGGSKMEKEIMTETLRKLRNGIIEKQVVSGHEFKGCPFYSKPKIIHFKDLDVGKTYKKKITLTNASYTINFCKLVGVSDHLRDFISIQFDPPGQLSAGMSCEMTVIFRPMINEDLEGEVMMLSQTGPFSIPVKCTTKKCELAVDKKCIDFGTHVIGETVTQYITLTNEGALGTRFSVKPITQVNDAKKTPPDVSSRDMMPSTSVINISPDADVRFSPELTDQSTEIAKSSQEEVVPEQSSPQREDARSPQFPTHTTEESAVDEEELLRDSLEETGDIKLGEGTDGEIGAFSSIKIPLTFSPSFPGTSSSSFEIFFENQSCKTIQVTATGLAIDVPVYVPNCNIDLKICMYDRLYQDSIVVKNRATTALRLKFEVCKELRNHMELLPKTGFIQAQSAFSVQLKFLPRPSLPQDASAYFDKETGVLEAPLTISVVDQTRPISFTVHAVVTTSDLEISPKEVNFGHCTIYEAVQASIQLSNKSILPQEFGFMGIPEYVDIQPNDGFGTILPLETITLDIILKAPKAGEYKFDLTCKSAINRQFKISCKAIGVHPPLELSDSLVQFPATALNDTSTATIYVVNSHTSRNEFTHPVPRIGKGGIAPVGPTSFQFQLPEDSPITISPSVGTVLPGKRCLIQVSFKPTLLDQEIREEAVRMLRRAIETKALLDKQAEPVVENEAMSKKDRREVSSKKDKRKQLASPKQVQKEGPLKSVEQTLKELPKTEDIKVDSDEYAAARVSIYRRFMGKFKKYKIPCFIASCDVSKRSAEESLNFSLHNTLYLELHCPAVAPPLIVSSENGRHLISFGEIAIGQRVVKRVALQNISSEPVKPRFSILNPCGPFVLLNPVGVVEPGAKCLLLIAFAPEEDKTFFENLEVHNRQATLTLGIKGRGLAPSLSCSLETGILDMGYVLAKDSTTSTFKLHNTSRVPVNYSIKLRSLSVTQYEEMQKLPDFITSQKSGSFVGPQNYNGRSVFSVSPVEGIIQPDKTQDFTVSFSPDHESVLYSDILTVELFGKHIEHTIHLKGASRNHIMFIEGGDPIEVPTESLSNVPVNIEESDEALSSLVVTLQCTQTEDEMRPAVRELYIGCIRTLLSSSKKNVEFIWDNVQLLQQKGFTIEPVKAVVDAGQRKTVSITWIPPAGYDPSNPAMTTAKLTLKGDIIETYQVIFTTQVVSL
ncbi:cilia- and flagella-associated protein 74 isoform X2 [Engystomops pustulosus]|uniref:cilia- and flagella-associated protein 74 isoform X2 n=1 Tax=Engystomops pustulosus TaxID=76066 RepID=UPI003AFA1BFE